MKTLKTQKAEKSKKVNNNYVCYRAECWAMKKVDTRQMQTMKIRMN